MPPLAPDAIARLLDHAVLHPAAGPAETLAACELARRHRTAALCVKPCFTSLARAALDGSGVAVCAVVAFPHGNSATAVKAAETRAALDDGAAEIDAVLNIGLAAAGQWDALAAEITALQSLCAGRGALLKLILETALLSPGQIRRLCELALAAGAAFVKTSTGFAFLPRPGGGFEPLGATEEAVRIMVSAAAGRMGVKASGGIRTLAQVLRYHALGCSRIGTASTAEILREAAAAADSGALPSLPGADTPAPGASPAPPAY